MEALRQAVDALDHYLDAAELVRTSFDALARRKGPEPLFQEEAAPTRALAPEAWSAHPSPSPPASTIDDPDEGDRGPMFPRFRDRSTGLYTRAGFDAVAEGELKRCTRHSRLFSVLLIKLSGAAGVDLAGAAKTVRTGLRASDPVGSEGGRLLLIGLPETATADARAIGRRLADALEVEGAWDADGRLGVSTPTTNGASVSGLIESARSQLVFAPERVPTEISGNDN